MSTATTSLLPTGRPTGIFLRDGVLVDAAELRALERGGGSTDARRPARDFRGTWRGTGQRRSLNFLNNRRGRMASLSSRPTGARRPRESQAHSPRCSAPFRSRRPTPISSSGPRRRVRHVGAAPAGDGGARRPRQRGRRSCRRRRYRVRADAAADPPTRLVGVSDAIGGGPVLVRDGAPVYRANEGFTSSQLAPRARARQSVSARTAGSSCRRRRSAARLLDRDDELRARADPVRSARCAGWSWTAADRRRSPSRGGAQLAVRR